MVNSYISYYDSVMSIMTALRTLSNVSQGHSVLYVMRYPGHLLASDTAICHRCDKVNTYRLPTYGTADSHRDSIAAFIINGF